MNQEPKHIDRNKICDEREAAAYDNESQKDHYGDNFDNDNERNRMPESE